VDTLGNVLAVRKGEGENRLRVMLAAHMDEIGFMIVEDEEQGIFRFETVGSIDVRQLVGKPVQVGKDKVLGVIGAKPIHLTTSEERKQPITLETLRIDVGPDNARKVKVGDWATFATPFERIGPSLRGKAMDDRMGVVNLIELVKLAPPNLDLLAAFTVQEEVGLRGAKVAAYALDPQIAIALDCTPAYDLPPWNSAPCDTPADCPENTRYNTRLGAGPALYVADAATLSDPRLIRHVIDTADTLGIPYQIRQAGGGGTDAGAIHLQRAGIPSMSISVPGRYLHTAASLCRLEDWKNTLALVHAALLRLSPAIFDVDR
jgi:putative aminopeptidase FrvX